MQKLLEAFNSERHQERITINNDQLIESEMPKLQEALKTNKFLRILILQNLTPLNTNLIAEAIRSNNFIEVLAFENFNPTKLIEAASGTVNFIDLFNIPSESINPVMDSISDKPTVKVISLGENSEQTVKFFVDKLDKIPAINHIRLKTGLDRVLNPLLTYFSTTRREFTVSIAHPTAFAKTAIPTLLIEEMVRKLLRYPNIIVKGIGPEIMQIIQTEKNQKSKAGLTSLEPSSKPKSNPANISVTKEHDLPKTVSSTPKRKENSDESPSSREEQRKDKKLKTNEASAVATKDASHKTEDKKEKQVIPASKKRKSSEDSMGVEKLKKRVKELESENTHVRMQYEVLASVHKSSIAVLKDEMAFLSQYNYKLQDNLNSLLQKWLPKNQPVANRSVSPVAPQGIDISMVDVSFQPSPTPPPAPASSGYPIYEKPSPVSVSQSRVAVGVQFMPKGTISPSLLTISKTAENAQAKLPANGQIAPPTLDAAKPENSPTPPTPAKSSAPPPKSTIGTVTIGTFNVSPVKSIAPTPLIPPTKGPVKPTATMPPAALNIEQVMPTAPKTPVAPNISPVKPTAPKTPVAPNIGPIKPIATTPVAPTPGSSFFKPADIRPASFSPTPVTVSTTPPPSPPPTLKLASTPLKISVQKAAPPSPNDKTNGHLAVTATTGKPSTQHSPPAGQPMPLDEEYQQFLALQKK